MNNNNVTYKSKSSRSVARWGMAAAGLAMTLANISPAFADRRVTLPSGTVIPVKLNQALSSKSNYSGDRFFATVKYGADDAGLPEGTRIEGVIRESLPSYDGKPGVLDVDFKTVVFPNGQRQPVTASLYSLDGKTVKRGDGRLVATADKNKDRMKWVGIGAGAGALIGVLTKGNTLVDALLGGAAGYLYNELQNKKPGEVALKEGAEFGVKLDSALAFNMTDRDYTRLSSYRDEDYRDSRYERDSRYSSSDRYYQERVDRTNRDDRYYDDRLDRDRDTRLDRNRDDRYYDNRLDRNRDTRLDRTDRYYDSRLDRTQDDRFYTDRDRLNNRYGNDIGVMLDRREVRFSTTQKPYMRGDIVYVPIETVARAANVDFRYDAAGRMIRMDRDRIRLATDSRIAIVNGERRRLPAAPEVRNGVVFVPMEFAGFATGGAATWDRASRTVVITTDRDRY
jgi:hypothetical protein